VEIGPNPIKINGRQFGREEILFANPRKPDEFSKFQTNEQADFTMAFRSKHIFHLYLLKLQTQKFSA